MSENSEKHWFLRQRKHTKRVSEWGLLGGERGNNYDYSLDFETGEVTGYFENYESMNIRKRKITEGIGQFLSWCGRMIPSMRNTPLG